MNTMKAALRRFPEGTPAIALGLGVLGVTTYGFLLLSGQLLGDAKYASLGSLWILVFLIGPGFFFPVEQEIGRAVAARLALGQGIKPVLVRASILAGTLCALLFLVVAIVSPVLLRELFDHHGLLLISFFLALAGMALEYITRGTLAGNNRLGDYGLLMGAEGTFRLLAAGALGIFGVETAGPYGLLIGLAPFVAVLAVVRGKRRLLTPGPEAQWAELSSSLGSLIAASLFAQTLANAAPLVVKAMVNSSEKDAAGAFVKAVVITRIPLFLFQAVQAAMLPRLTHLATTNRHDDFRSLFVKLFVAVGAVGVLGVAAVALLGPELLKSFGSDYGLPRSDIVLLAIGSGLFLLTMTSAQALVALKCQSLTTIGWFIGVVIFFALIALPIGASVIVQTEIALLIGSAASTVVMVALVFSRIPREVPSTSLPG